MRTSSALILLAAIAALLIPAPALADRMTQVNDRLENQSGRIQTGRKGHKMNMNEQTRRDEADYRIEAQEQAMAGRHNGKLTKRDQRRLNRELNRNSRKIYHDKHD